MFFKPHGWRGVCFRAGIDKSNMCTLREEVELGDKAGALSHLDCLSCSGDIVTIANMVFLGNNHEEGNGDTRIVILG